MHSYKQLDQIAYLFIYATRTIHPGTMCFHPFPSGLIPLPFDFLLSRMKKRLSYNSVTFHSGPCPCFRRLIFIILQVNINLPRNKRSSVTAL